MMAGSFVIFQGILTSIAACHVCIIRVLLMQDVCKIASDTKCTLECLKSSFILLLYFVHIAIEYSDCCYILVDLYSLRKFEIKICSVLTSDLFNLSRGLSFTTKFWDKLVTMFNNIAYSSLSIETKVINWPH